MRLFLSISVVMFGALVSDANAKKLQINETTVSFAPLITNPKGNNPLQHVPTTKVWVENPVLRISCYQKKKPGTQVYNGCDQFKVNGVDVGSYEHQGMEINFDSKDLLLKKVSKNTFKLPDVNIEYSPKNGGYLCVLVASPQLGGLPQTGPPSNVYYHSFDRYSLLSYCDRQEIPEWGLYSGRFANRQMAFGFFYGRLLKPIPVKIDGALLQQNLDAK